MKDLASTGMMLFPFFCWKKLSRATLRRPQAALGLVLHHYHHQQQLAVHQLLAEAPPRFSTHQHTITITSQLQVNITSCSYVALLGSIALGTSTPSHHFVKIRGTPLRLSLAVKMAQLESSRVGRMARCKLRHCSVQRQQQVHQHKQQVI